MNYLHGCRTSMHIKFADDGKLGGTVEPLIEWRGEVLKRDLDRQEAEQSPIT